MTPDYKLSVLAFFASLQWLADVRALQEPVPYGLAQKWASYLADPAALEHLYEQETSPYWYGYAAVMQELREVFDSKDKTSFVPKKNKPR